MTQTILITGCSSGIGLCAATTLHKRGYRVFASARKPADVERLKESGLSDALVLDVADSASIRQALAQVLEKTGGTLDALFNNAGYATPGAVDDLTREMMRQQFETNVFGPMELTNLVIPVMRKQGHGRIIQNTSILGVITMPYRGNYNASKFALEAFAATLRQELRHSAIYVSIIAPGPIATQFRTNAFISFHDNIGFDSKTPHTTRYETMQDSFQKPASKGQQRLTLKPDAVVKKLIHALEAPVPKTRYYVGLPAHLFAWLRRLLPDRGLDWIVDQSLKGEKS
jgi:NAD(P)-dependent dehydrogenase (short-subunit alcohol dehydrogenase family)